MLPGNHDVSDEHPGAFEKVFPGRTRYWVDTGKYRLLFHIGDRERNEGGVPSPFETWLDSQISNTPNDKPVILFTHYPYGKGVKYSVPGRKRVIKSLKRRRLLAILSGHFHGDTTVVEDGVLFKSVPCLTSTRSNHDGTAAKGSDALRAGQRCDIGKVHADAGTAIGDAQVGPRSPNGRSSLRKPIGEGPFIVYPGRL